MTSYTVTSGIVGWGDVCLLFGWFGLLRRSSLPVVLRFMVILPPAQKQNVRVHMIMNKTTVCGRL